MHDRTPHLKPNGGGLQPPVNKTHTSKHVRKRCGMTPKYHEQLERRGPTKFDIHSKDLNQKIAQTAQHRTVWPSHRRLVGNPTPKQLINLLTLVC